jgi:hypothetical protein
MACSRSGIVALLLVAACQPKEDSSENIFASGSSSSTTATETSTTPMTTGIDMGETEGTGFEPPATYRFDCVDIQGVGNGDGTVIQAQVLENTWAADIDNFKLNIMIEVIDRDEEAGTATLGIRSGIGTNASDMCVEATSQSEMIDVDYIPSQVSWAPIDMSGQCSTMATATEGVTYDMALPADRVVYIYAQDTNTVTFNCTPDEALPDAVPIRAVEAQLSSNADETIVAGTLTGCLVESDAMGLCSCLASCNNDGPGDLQTEGECAGCPTGGVPLNQLLGDVGTSDRCTNLVGAPAFDLVLGFTGTLLPNVPTLCG